MASNFTNNFATIFTVTNTVGAATNYLDLGAATNVPAFYYRVRLVLYEAEDVKLCSEADGASKVARTLARNAPNIGLGRTHSDMARSGRCLRPE